MHIDLFDHAVALMKAQAAEAVASYRAQQTPDPERTFVWLLWSESVVLGVYASEEKALESGILFTRTVPWWVEKRLVG